MYARADDHVAVLCGLSASLPWLHVATKRCIIGFWFAGCIVEVDEFGIGILAFDDKRVIEGIVVRHGFPFFLMFFVFRFVDVRTCPNRPLRCDFFDFLALFLDFVCYHEI